MALSDLYKKKAAEVAAERERLAVERAKSSIKSIMDSDQFKLSALALPEGQYAVEAIIQNTVTTVLDPVGQMLDTLRAKGFRPAEIRKLVHNLHDMYNLDPVCPPGSGVEPTHEEMIRPVAEWLVTHQELYNTFDPEMLRGQ